MVMKDMREFMLTSYQNHKGLLNLVDILNRIYTKNKITIPNDEHIVIKSIESLRMGFMTATSQGLANDPRFAVKINLVYLDSNLKDPVATNEIVLE
jgi:hypothetical protein